MNIAKNNGFSLKTACAIIALLAIFLMSCATKKKVVNNEKENIKIVVDSVDKENVFKDILTIIHSIQSEQTNKIEIESKIEKYDSTATTVNSNGNIIKQETWHKEKETLSRNFEYERLLIDSIRHYQHIVDSLIYYKEKCDSLINNSSKSETIYVEKEKISKIYKISLIISILCCIFAIIKIIRYIQIH